MVEMMIHPGLIRAIAVTSRLRAERDEERERADLLQRRYDAVMTTLNEIGAPTHEGHLKLNANGRLVDWLAGRRM